MCPSSIFTKLLLSWQSVDNNSVISRDYSPTLHHLEFSPSNWFVVTAAAENAALNCYYGLATCYEGSLHLTVHNTPLQHSRGAATDTTEAIN